MPSRSIQGLTSDQIRSDQSLSRVRLFATPWVTACQASLSITNSRSSPDSRPSSQWCHPAISSSVVPFSSCPQSLPASESFPMSQLFAWGGQSTGISALASFLPKKPQGWSPSEWTGWISLQSKGLLRVFSNTTVQKHQLFRTSGHYNYLGFPGGSDGKEPACNAGDLDLISWMGRSPGGRHGNSLQYSCLENSHGQRSLAGYGPWGL